MNKNKLFTKNMLFIFVHKENKNQIFQDLKIKFKFDLRVG